MRADYLELVKLLARVAPIVFAQPGFALKGGSAINLFVRELPRLSVDLDLVFLDRTSERLPALATIAAALHAMADHLTRLGFVAHLPQTADGHEARLLVRQGRLEVKVEVNSVLRGAVLPARTARLTEAARARLKADLRLPVLATEELYAGKLVAMLDRQHPRDLFDLKLLLENEGITTLIRRCFVAYLAFHNRPIHEVLFARPQPLDFAYKREFVGMTAQPVALNELQAVQTALLRSVPAALDGEERAFLRSLARAEPEWALLGLPHLSEMPAARWKMANLLRLRQANPRKFQAQIRALEVGLDSG